MTKPTPVADKNRVKGLIADARAQLTLADSAMTNHTDGDDVFDIFSNLVDAMIVIAEDIAGLEVLNRRPVGG